LAFRGEFEVKLLGLKFEMEFFLSMLEPLLLRFW